MAVGNSVVTGSNRVRGLRWHDFDCTGWFSENVGRQFTDENGNTFEFDVLGRFFRKDEPEYDLHYVRLKKDGITFEFDYRIFQDHI